MVIEPKIRGFICTTAHPAGCAEHVARQVKIVQDGAPFAGVKKALIIGCSTGYGLASRIALAFGAGAATLGVAYENPASGKRTATAGWYNTAAFEKTAAARGLFAETILGDAFSREIKNEVVARLKEKLGKVDLVVYSLAAPRRTDETGVKYSSVIKPVGEPFTNKTIDLSTRLVSEVTVPPATEEEVAATVKVMGGEDWELWIAALAEAGVLEENFTTVAYSYIGPKITHPVYLDGSIGMAKRHLKATADALNGRFEALGCRALISVNKALVTQSSAAIPVVPLYISILYKIMKEQGLHEGCIEQMRRLFGEKLYGPAGPRTDAEGYLRLDDLEMRADIQQAVDEAWTRIDNGSLASLADIDGYWSDFYNLFGFGFDNVDYAADVEPDVKIPSIGA